MIVSKYKTALEDMTCWLAHACQQAVYEYHDKYQAIIRFDNPNRRELTDDEYSEMMRCPIIQGGLNRIALRKMAEEHTNRKSSLNLDVIEANILHGAAINYSKSDYINNLEDYVCWLSSYYIQLKFAFRDNHLEESRFDNPNKRKLLNTELDEVFRFPLVQDIHANKLVKRLAAIEPEPTTNLHELVKCLLQK